MASQLDVNAAQAELTQALAVEPTPGSNGLDDRDAAKARWGVETPEQQQATDSDLPDRDAAEERLKVAEFDRDAFEEERDEAREHLRVAASQLREFESRLSVASASANLRQLQMSEAEEAREADDAERGVGQAAERLQGERAEGGGGRGCC